MYIKNHSYTFHLGQESAYSKQPPVELATSKSGRQTLVHFDGADEAQEKLEFALL